MSNSFIIQIVFMPSVKNLSRWGSLGLVSLRRQGIQYNYTQHNDIQHDYTLHNDTQRNDIQQNDN